MPQVTLNQTGITEAMLDFIVATTLAIIVGQMWQFLGMI
jgi:hypothetical protein